MAREIELNFPTNVVNHSLFMIKQLFHTGLDGLPGPWVSFHGPKEEHAPEIWDDGVSNRKNSLTTSGKTQRKPMILDQDY